MENSDITQEQWFKDMAGAHRRGKIMGGLLLVSIGALFLARELGAILPAWLFSWKMLLVGIGLVSAVKHKFRHASWIVLMGIGGIFLLGDLYPDLHIKPILWPVLIIFVGLFMMFKPRRNYFSHKHYRKAWKHGYRHHWAEHDGAKQSEGDNEDMIQAVSIMGGIKKNIYSKNFKGGEVVNVFGSAEINLMQADFDKQAKLEITQVFGGTKLLIPANWEIKSELATVMGGYEDNRPNTTVLIAGEKKVLILSGTAVMGGIEVSSY